MGAMMTANARTLTVRALAGDPSTIEMWVYGPIGAPEWNAPESTEAREIVAAIRAAPGVKTIRVRINSTGGSVADGLAIYNALREHSARVIVTVDGLAASIASCIAMAGDEVEMPEASLMMVHAPWTVALGNAAQLRVAAEVLDRYANLLAGTYARRSGKPLAHWLRVLEDGLDHYYTAAEAVAAGLADRIVDTATEPLPIAAAARGDFNQFTARAPARYAALLRALTTPKEHDMNTTTQTPASAPADPMAAMRERNARIDEIARQYPADTRVQAIARECLADLNVTTNAFYDRVLATLAARAEPLGPSSHYGSTAGNVDAWQPNRGDDFSQAAGDALAIRAGIKVAKPHPAAADLRMTSVQDLARASLSRAGRHHRDLAGAALVKAALSTGDFPALLSNALGKAIRMGFESDTQSHAAWVRASQVNDFRTQTRPILGAAPSLDKLFQGEEYRNGPWSEDSATFALEKFGKLFSISWESLLADDLGAFLRVPQALGAAARRVECDSVYANLTAAGGAGVLMQDGQPLFHTSHANIVSTAANPDATSLGAARALLRRQRPVGGAGFLNLVPAFLIVPPELETAAEILIASASRHVTGASGATTDGAQTPWIAGLTLVVEPRLSGFWYVAANTAQVDTVEVATLAEANFAPIVEELPGEGAKTDTIVWKVKHPHSARALDWRGLVRIAIPT
jgi:ATP-dependent protease ClpP protease subunit